MAVLISFAALLVLWPQPRWKGRTPGITIAGATSAPLRVVKAIGRAFGLAAFVLVLVAAFAGENDPADNIAPVAVYVTSGWGLRWPTGWWETCGIC